MQVADHRVDLLRADHRDRDDRRPSPDRGGHEPSASEAAQSISLVEAFAGAARALGKDEHELIALEQPARVVGMPDGLPRPAQEPAHHRHTHELARHERAHVARPRMLREDGGLDHRAVPGQHAGVVGDQKRATRGGHVLDAGRLDAPVVAVERLERGEERLRPLPVESEVVHRVVRSAPCELSLLVDELHDLHHSVEVDHVPPGEAAKARVQLTDALDRVHRRIALQPPDRLRQAKTRTGRHDDLRLLAVPPALPRGFGDHFAPPALRATTPLIGRSRAWRSRRRRCWR